MLGLVATLGPVAPAAAQSTIELKQPDGTTLSILLDDTQPVTIDPASGALEATASSAFSCSSGCDEVKVSLATADGGSFNVNGESAFSVTEGGSVRFNWEARGGWVCTGNMFDAAGAFLTVGGWSDGSELPPRGARSVSLADLAPGSYTASVTCSNGPNNSFTSATVDIEILKSGFEITDACKGRQPGSVQASKVCWQGNETVDCFSYANVFGDFPLQGSQNGIEFIQHNNTYTSMKFSTAGMTEKQGSWQFEIPQLDGGQGPKLVTLSQCPGDFDKKAIDAEMGPFCYAPTGSTGTVSWKRDGVLGARCELEIGPTYYLNILYTTDPGGTPPSDLTWDCNGKDSALCGNLLVPKVTK